MHYQNVEAAANAAPTLMGEVFSVIDRNTPSKFAKTDPMDYSSVQTSYATRWNDFDYVHCAVIEVAALREINILGKLQSTCKHSGLYRLPTCIEDWRGFACRTAIRTCLPASDSRCTILRPTKPVPPKTVTWSKFITLTRLFTLNIDCTWIKKGDSYWSCFSWQTLPQCWTCNLDHPMVPIIVTCRPIVPRWTAYSWSIQA